MCRVPRFEACRQTQEQITNSLVKISRTQQSTYHELNKSSHGNITNPIHCDTLQYTAIHCNTLQHTASHEPNEYATTYTVCCDSRSQQIHTHTNTHTHTPTHTHTREAGRRKNKSPTHQSGKFHELNTYGSTRALRPAVQDLSRTQGSGKYHELNESGK